MGDASQLIELLEYVVTEYHAVFHPYSSFSVDPPVSVAKVTQHIEDTAHWMIHISLFIHTEPMLDTLFPKYLTLTSNCLSALSKSCTSVFVKTFVTFIDLICEIVEALSTDFQTYQLKTFQSSLFPNHTINIQYEWCFDQLMRVSLLAMKKSASEFMDVRFDLRSRILHVVTQVLPTSFIATKTAALDLAVTYVHYYNSQCSVVESDYCEIIISCVRAVEHEKVHMENFEEAENFPIFVNKFIEVISSVVGNFRQFGNSDWVDSKYEKSVKVIFNFVKSRLKQITNPMISCLLKFLDAFWGPTNSIGSLSESVNDVLNLLTVSNRPCLEEFLVFCLMHAKVSEIKEFIEKLVSVCSLDKSVSLDAKLNLFYLLLNSLANSVIKGLIIVNFFDNIQVKSIVTFIKDSLTTRSPTEDQLGGLLSSVTSALVVFQGFVMDKDTCNLVAWLCAFPWLSTQGDWLDLKALKSSLSTHVSALKPVISTSLEMICVKNVCLVFCFNSGKSVVSCYQKCLKNKEIVKKAIQFSPFLIHGVKNSANFTTFLTDMMLPVLQKNQFDSHFFKNLVYSMCPKTTIKLDSSFEPSNQKVDELLEEKYYVDFILPLLKHLNTNCTNVDSVQVFLDCITTVLDHVKISNYFGIIEILGPLMFFEDSQLSTRSSEVLGNVLSKVTLISPEVIDYLKNTLNSVPPTKEVSWNFAKLSAYVNIGKSCKDCEPLLIFCILNTAELLFFQDSSLREFAATCLQNLSTDRGLVPNEFFSHYKEYFCDLLVAVCSNHNSAGFVPYLNIFCVVFEFPDYKSLLIDISPMFIPKVVFRNSEVSRSLIQELSPHSGLSEDKFLQTYIVQILSYLLSNGVELSDLHSYFSSFPDTCREINKIVYVQVLAILFDLCSFLSKKQEAVLLGCARLSELDSRFQNDTKHLSGKPTELALASIYIQYRLLSILVHFKGILVLSSTPIQQKKKCIKNTIVLIRIAGQKAISQHSLKVLDNLRFMVKFESDEYDQLNIEAFKAFVETLDKQKLEPLIPQIAVVLLPLLNRKPKMTSSIYNLLKEGFTNPLCRLYFLPPVLELSDLVAERGYLLKCEESQIDSHLEIVIKGLGEENLEARMLVLQNFKLMLSENNNLVDVFGANSLAQLPVQLVRLLVLQFSAESVEVKRLAADCFGLIGALDPCKVVDFSNLAGTSTTLFASVETNEFRNKLIVLLAQSYFGSSTCNNDPKMLDCCAYSLQELLTHFDCKNRSAGSGKRLWDSFNQEIQQFLTPYLNSKYTYKLVKVTQERESFYSDENVTSHKNWVCQFIEYLIKNVTEPKSVAIFQACEPVLRYNQDVAMHLLPVVIIELVWEGHESSRALILREFLVILKDAASGNPTRSFCKVTCQAVFVTLETMSMFETDRMSEILWQNAKSVTKSDVDVTGKRKCEAIRSFLNDIPPDLIAKSALECKAYARALLYMEEHFFRTSHPDASLSSMQEIYVELNEPDGVKGVAAIHKRNLTTYEKILNFKSQNKMNEALVCCAAAIVKEPQSLQLHKEYLQCFMSTGQVDTAKYHANGYISENSAWENDLLPFSVEACWKLCDWDQMGKVLGSDNSDGSMCSNYESQFGKGVMELHAGQWERLNNALHVSRDIQIESLTAASMENSNSYLRGYDSIVKLQMISNVEITSTFLQNFDSTKMKLKSVERFCETLRERESLLQPSFAVLEPSRQLQRSLLSIVSEKVSEPNLTKLIKNEIELSWLSTSRLARLAGYFDTALKSLEHMGGAFCLESVLEQSLLLKDKGNLHEAFAVLQKYVSDNKITSDMMKIRGTPDSMQASKTRILAQIFLETGKIMENTSIVDSNTILKQYKSVTENVPDFEEGHFCLGQYYERITSAMGSVSEVSSAGVIATIHNCYVETMAHGNKYIFQALPKLIRIWLDLGSKLVADRDSKEKNLEKTEQNVRILNERMEKVLMSGKIAPYQFFSAFSQLLSRICHPLPSVWEVLKKILASLLAEFPHQAVWMSMAVLKSSYETRSNRCRLIFAEAVRIKGHGLEKYTNDSIKLADKLQELSFKTDFTETELSVRTHFRYLSRLLEAPGFSAILIPRQEAMTIVLPEGKPSRFQPFGRDIVSIHRLDDKIEVMYSMQKPKKITIIGSDGKQYPMMTKPKDDLRKDNRLMEFNSMINKFLKSNTEARRRQLHIRTYAVVPLNEDCGIIEWVNNTCAFRSIVMRLMKEKTVGLSMKEIKACQLPKNASISDRLEIYNKKLLPGHTPSVFSQWFKRNFRDPTSWHLARLAYCRTVAVMSVVGYILGLGDRHGENILFDSTNGDCVHVDFNCLFNKGETLEFPEVVPFRLTHNMLDAMGPMGHEGFFRVACEVTMKIMWERKDSLMSILKPFLHDPLVEWSKVRKRNHNASATNGDGKENESGENGTKEPINEMAQTHITNIENRLQGKIKRGTSKAIRGLPLSVEGQVEHIISEAISEQNLCQMYIGWAAYL